APKTRARRRAGRPTGGRTGAGGPPGPAPPITWPVDWRTKSGSARFTFDAPTSSATRPVSTRCAPLVSTSSGAPSALKTRLLAIAPTSQPSRAAAVAAVGAGSGSSRTSPDTPSPRSTPATFVAVGCIPTGYWRGRGIPRKLLAGARYRRGRAPVRQRDDAAPSPSPPDAAPPRPPTGARSVPGGDRRLAAVRFEQGRDRRVAAGQLERVGRQLRERPLVPLPGLRQRFGAHRL